MFENIKASILRFGNFSEAEISEVLDKLTVLEIKKNEFLIEEGMVCREFYFINKGALRQYTILDDGTDATVNLFVPNDWFFEYKSFTTQSKSETNIQATEDCELFVLTAHQFHSLVKKSDLFFRMGRIFEQIVHTQDYQNNRISQEDKYALLLKTKPAILQHFSLKHIASYLGMTPETLSRIRRKIIS